MKFTGIENKRYWDNLHLTGGWRKLWDSRERHIRTRQFPILTKETLFSLVTFLKGKRVLDVGAGIGYLTYHLRKGGIDSTPIVIKKNDYCFKRNFFKKRLIVSDCLTHDISKFNTFIISWPDYTGEHAYKFLLRLSPGDTVIYQGEGEGGCCATDEFFNELEENFELNKDITKELNNNHVTFSYIHDRWMVYTKK